MQFKKCTGQENYNSISSILEITSKKEQRHSYLPYFRHREKNKSSSIDNIEPFKPRDPDSAILPSFKYKIDCIKSHQSLALSKLEAIKNFPKPKKSAKYITNKLKPKSFSPQKLQKSEFYSRQPSMIYGKSSRSIKTPELTHKFENQSIGFFQENVHDSPEPSKIDKFQKKLKKFYDYDLKDMKNIYELHCYNPKTLEAYYITQQETSEIMAEYKKPDDQRDYLFLDTILVKNFFFARFNREVRIKLLQISTPHEYKSGQLIVTEGNKATDMFAIIRGAIVIEKESEECRNHVLPVASLYDGRYFGELSLENCENNGIKNYSSVTCKATENTLVFAIPKICYNNILLAQLENSLDKKILFLTETALFQNVNPFSLIPLATNLEIISFKNNQEILKKGEKPQGLYIIVKGFAMAVTEGFRIKQRPKQKDLRSSKKALKSLIKSPTIFNNLNEKNDYKDQEKNINSLLMKANSNNWEEYLAFLSTEEQKISNQDSILVKERIEYSILKEKDYFGCRTILNALNRVEKNIEPAKFSIVPQSANVEVMILKPNHFSYLPESLIESVVRVLESSYEIDSPPEVDIKYIDNIFAEWIRYKESIFIDIQNCYLSEKKKKLFPFFKD
ncbi:hypothetical protein SteCoe_15240 [Stentor coeruleus]|uniref:Cyclic nucleotide-binding domain-containing protein n=1 Tax=Stentor coeruleus TaxID=5963 RepID=A0A1R2C413_9CILI|nr:hypothetical protein SteCoe_15240 [Stentor coeruleus]